MSQSGRVAAWFVGAGGIRWRSPVTALQSNLRRRKKQHHGIYCRSRATTAPAEIGDPPPTQGGVWRTRVKPLFFFFYDLIVSVLYRVLKGLLPEWLSGQSNLNQAGSNLLCIRFFYCRFSSNCRAAFQSTQQGPRACDVQLYTLRLPDIDRDRFGLHYSTKERPDNTRFSTEPWGQRSMSSTLRVLNWSHSTRQFLVIVPALPAYLRYARVAFHTPVPCNCDSSCTTSVSTVCT